MKQKNDLISIIVPVYNVEKKVDKCIKSILQQTYTNLEIILINDGSTDDSGKICEEYSKQYEKIKYIDNRNEGVSKSRNIGIENALGKYICFVDSDDFIDKTYIEKLYNNTSNRVLSICNFTKFCDENIKENVIHQKTKVESYNKNEFLKLYKMKLINAPWAKLYDRDVIYKKNIRFDEELSLGEDLLFNLTYLKEIEKINLISDSLYYYRQGTKNSLSNKYYENMFEIQEKLCNQFCDFFKYNSEQEKSSEIVKFCTTIISNELHNANCSIIKRYFNARKMLENAYVKDTIKKQKKYMSKTNYFLLSHKLYISYKLKDKCKKE